MTNVYLWTALNIKMCLECSINAEPENGLIVTLSYKLFSSQEQDASSMKTIIPGHVNWASRVQTKPRLTISFDSNYLMHNKPPPIPLLHQNEKVLFSKTKTLRPPPPNLWSTWIGNTFTDRNLRKRGDGNKITGHWLFPIAEEMTSYLLELVYIFNNNSIPSGWQIRARVQIITMIKPYKIWRLFTCSDIMMSYRFKEMVLKRKLGLLTVPKLWKRLESTWNSGSF